MRLRSSTLAACAAVVAMFVASCAPERATGPLRPGLSFGPVGALTTVRIAEFHYDNVGTDVGEAIEISGPAGTDVTGWKIVLYNGASTSLKVYDTKTLSGTIPATCGARGVVVQTYPVNGIQNGDPDGIALVNAGGQVVQFFSYGGTFTALDGPALGLTSTDFGAKESGTTPVGFSLQLDASGNWAAAANTFGACNDDTGAPGPAVVASVTVSPATLSITQGNHATFTATAFDASSQPIAGVTFTWSSDNTAAATVSASGVATGVAPGDAHIIATAPNTVAGSAALHVSAPAPPGLPETRLSELHYDNVGTDVGEAIEVEGPAGTDLTGWTVLLYNGNGGAVYDTKTLSGTIPATCGGRGVMTITYPVNGIQNGSPDGMALVDAGGNVIEFLSYEGVFAATGGAAAGLTSTDIVAFENSSPIGQSLQRDAFDHWQLAAATFGACNGTGSPPPTGTSVSVTMNLPRQAPAGFVKPAFPTVRDPNGVVVSPTPALTWTSSDPTIASVDGNGYVSALTPGGPVTIRATEPGGAFGETTFDVLPTTVPTGAVYHDNTMFGVPTDADPSDDIMITRPQYALSYNAARGGPNWVGANINVTTFGAAPRCDCFSPDPLLPGNVYHVVDFDFRNGGYDRGHMTQSEPRTDTYQENATTFYLTNILPQAAENNQGPWSQLENYLNDLVRLSGKEVWVYSGGEYASSPGTLKNAGAVQIPDYTWKVAVVLNAGQTLSDVHTLADLQVIAVKMPNLTTPGVPGSAVGIRNTPWQNFQTTVDQIEAAAGYDLLAALPDQVEIPLEANDQPPVAVAGGPYTGAEGGAIAFDGSASSDPDAEPLTYAWDFGDGATGSGATPSHAYADNGAFTATLTVTDPHGAFATASASVTVLNVPPVIGAFAATPSPARVGTPVQATVTFSDVGSLDTHQTIFAWGDGTMTTVPGEGTVSATHVYQTPALYTPTATVIDKDGGTTTRAAASYIAVYGAEFGFLSGSGSFQDAAGRATVQADVNWVRGWPEGTMHFTNGAGTIDLISHEFKWLVVTPNLAVVAGTGRMNNVARFSYLLVIRDNSHPDIAPGGARIKILDPQGNLVYDNQPGQADDSDAVTMLSSGNVVIHH